MRRQNDKATALSYLERAKDQAIHADSAALGHVLQLLAYTYSDVGDATSFERTISEGTDLLAYAGEGRDVVKKEFTPFEVNEIRGKAMRDLGKPLDALPFLDLAELSLDTANSVTPRWRALLEISRGQALCDAGDIVAGITVISKGFVLAVQCHSRHQMDRVRKYLRKLENSPARTHPRVQELKALVTEMYLRIDDGIH
ncbi:hypothetical protein [Thermosporothrix hazakensis]|uniref:hypothetical protein n=1 Tax=Thermosporothrix hazakensis TaxID=644383 RepID=UPI0010F6A3EE|nr:hypothetical protein [Thermosporothrix hazakensis]